MNLRRETSKMYLWLAGIHGPVDYEWTLESHKSGFESQLSNFIGMLFCAGSLSTLSLFIYKIGKIAGASYSDEA